MKIPLLTVVFLLLQMSFSFVHSQTAQDHQITGTIADQNGPLPGVTVTVVGDPSTGSITDVNGSYTIMVSSEATTLEASFVGMKTMEIDINGRTVIDIVMEVEAVGLDELVVVGYGTQKKKSLTGAISTIDNEAIQTTTATSLAQKLQGKVAGLNIRQTTGEPGMYDNSINIRGFGTPLYVIDGIVRGDSKDFQRLRSEDIESISVLKDASAAIYGMNAANGVIIVTTKKGGTGKARFTLKSVTGWSSPTDVPEMANAAQYVEMFNDAYVNAGLEPVISPEEFANWQAGGPGYESTNWSEETMKKRSMRNEVSLTAEGGTEIVSYYMNAGVIKDNGLLQSGDINYNKFNFRTNISAKLTDNLTADINLAGFTDKRNTPADGVHNIWRGTVSQLPTSSVYANDNPDYLHRVQDGQSMNPVAIAQSDLTGYGIYQDSKFQSAFNLTYEAPFLEGLEFKGVASFDQSFYQGKGVRTDYELYDYAVEDDTYMPTSFNAPSNINNSYSNATLLTLQGFAIYKTTFLEDHNLGLTLVAEQKETKGRYAGIHKYYEFFTNAQIDQAGEENATSWGNESHQRFRSYIGRFNYDYKGKYLVEFAARYDGSYRYHPDQRYGLFTVVSGGWRVSEEHFLKDNFDWLSNLKIRGSYGTIGQDAGAPFQYVMGFSTSGGGTWEYVDGTLTNGAATPTIVNEELTWMESNIKDIGVDLGIFRNKLTFTADWYQRDRTGLLAYRNVSLPNTFGGKYPQENLNSDRVRGIEFSFTHNNQVGEFRYSVTGNVNFARTMNVYVEQGEFTSSWQKYRGGQSDRWQGIVWSYNNLGQFQDEEEILNAPIQNGQLGNSNEMPGDFKYEDVNGDGVIDGNDIVPNMYNETPRTHYGLSLYASWKGFDLNALIQGASNFTVRYTHAYTTMFWGDGNTPAYFMDRWHRADPYDPNSEWVAGEWPAIRIRELKQIGMLYAESDAWRRDASFVRIKNIELGYTLNKSAINRIGIDNIRVFSSINNLYTFADPFIKPFDPESTAGSYSAGWTYPLLRTFNFGLDINF
ncbi:MAG: TonB-dependent receptor [Bacteroidota bacterium]